MSDQVRKVGHRRTARLNSVGFGSQYPKCYMKPHGIFENGVRRRHLKGKKTKREAGSSHSEQSAELRGSCREDMGSRICSQMLVDARAARSSTEDLATDEQTNWQESQIRNLSIS